MHADTVTFSKEQRAAVLEKDAKMRMSLYFYNNIESVEAILLPLE